LSDLRQAREQAGLSIEEASKRTRIPERYLAALESGDHSVFPTGPFLSGYTRQYRAFLQLPERAPVVTPPPRSKPTKPEAPLRAQAGRAEEGPERPAPEKPRATVRRGQDDRTSPSVPSVRSRRQGLRMAALGALVMAVVVLSVAVFQRAFPPQEASVGEAPDQRVSLAVVAPVRARVLVDGRSELDGSLLPGAARTFAGHDKVAVELETLDGVTINFDGRLLTPLGARSRPRRLVFIDDATP